MKPDTWQSYKARILRVLVHLQSHLDDPLSLDDLAAIAHFSPFHFHRVFSGMVGESVKEHVRRLRLERAALRLRFSGEPVMRIALEAGYETHEAFTRAFKAMFDQSPTAFRRARRLVAHGAAPSRVHFSSSEGPDDFRAPDPKKPIAVTIENLPPMRVAFRRHVGRYDQVGPTWQALMAWAGSKGVFSTSPTYFGVAYDDPEITPPDKFRYDAAVTVPDRIAAEGEVGVRTIEAGRYAVTRHTGPYDTINLTYARLCGEWLPHSGRELRAAPALEFYRNAPQTTKPEDLVTDIHMPLER